MTAVQKEKQKKRITELHDKYYGKKKPLTTKKLGEICTDVLNKVTTPEEPKKPVVADSRNSLMLQVKAKGIKNFRILNKSELRRVLALNDQATIDAIVEGAVARWKSGWKSKKSLDTKE
jgi:hypothetical protein